MKSLIWILFLLILSSCGSHEQSLTRVSPEKPVVKVGETDPTLQLVNAVNSGDLVQVKASIEMGASLQVLTEDGLTLLIVALRAEQYAILDYLIQKGANPLQKTSGAVFDPALDSFGFIENILNVNSDVKELFKGILRAEEFDVSILNEKMFDAGNIKNKDLIAWLLARGADPNFVLKNRETPLIFLFKQRGLSGEELERLKQVFNVFLDHPKIDVNIKVGRRETTALEKAMERRDSYGDGSSERMIYQDMINQLRSKGAR